MAWAQLAIMAGKGLSAYGSYSAGKAKKEDLYAQARALIRNAKVTRAASQRAASDERKLADLAISEAIANAAASGAGASDPTVINLLAGLEAEGEYRALSQMFLGEEEAEGMEIQARYKRKSGRAAKRAGVLGAVKSIFS